MGRKKKGLNYFPKVCRICQQSFQARRSNRVVCYKRQCRSGLARWEKLDLKETDTAGLRKKVTTKKKRRPTPSQVFYESREWLELRYRVLKRYGRRCMLCYAEKVTMHVDHIKPRSKYPELELDENNMQVLCRACNLGKSNKHEDDWR